MQHLKQWLYKLPVCRTGRNCKLMAGVFNVDVVFVGGETMVELFQLQVLAENSETYTQTMTNEEMEFEES